VIAELARIGAVLVDRYGPAGPDLVLGDAATDTSV
jgi:hypothetical protein